jgi:hypothetical protein
MPVRVSLALYTTPYVPSPTRSKRSYCTVPEYDCKVKRSRTAVHLYKVVMMAAAWAACTRRALAQEHRLRTFSILRGVERPGAR